MDYIDIHSHLGFSDYGQDLLGVLINMRANNTATITVGADYKSSLDAIKLASENPDIFACIGYHPDDNREEVFDIAKYEELVKKPKVVAVGECGLDYFRLEEKFLKGELLKQKDNLPVCHSREDGNPVPKDCIPASAGMTVSECITREISKQKSIFQSQIELAKKYNKPLMVHLRDASKSTLLPKGQAYRDALEMLKDQGVTGNIHFFAGSLEEAKAFIEIGFTISFTGVITFARNYDEVIKNVPIEMIMAETDAPFVAPAPFRGQRNEPAYVHKVVEKIAEIRGEDILWVKHKMVENAKRVFKINI